MKKSKLFVPLLIVFIVVLWVVATGALVLFFGMPESAGTAGDTFGAVNALFSGLALAGVVYAIILQRHELEIQREEQTNSRRELSQQNTLIAEQLSTMRRSLDLELTKATLEALPRLRLKSIEENRISRIFHFQNVGGPIANMTAMATQDYCITLKPLYDLQTKEVLDVDLNRMGPEDFPEEIFFSIQYTDKLGAEGVLHYRVSVGANGGTWVEQCAALQSVRARKS